MRTWIISLGVVAVAFVAALSTYQWTTGSSVGVTGNRSSGRAIMSPGAADVQVTVPVMPTPVAVLINDQSDITAQTTITNAGPTADEIVNIETLDVPTDCDGQIGDSLVAVGSDVAVTFATLPGMSVGSPYNLSRDVGVTCHVAGRHQFTYRIEAQPLFGFDSLQSDNLREVPFSLCTVPDLSSDFDGDGLLTLDEPTYGTDPCNPDTDADNCKDGREIGASHSIGGQRDPLNQYDFFDVPVPYSTTFTLTGKNGSITAQDVLAVRTGTGHVSGDGIYNAQYDRTPSTHPGQLWRSGPPNGSITAQDILVMRDSTGDVCF